MLATKTKTMLMLMLMNDLTPSTHTFTSMYTMSYQTGVSLINLLEATYSHGEAQTI